jgi:hypothetical protein
VRGTSRIIAHRNGNQSPNRTYGVRAVAVGTSPRRTVCSNRPVRLTTWPCALTIALSPDTAACTTHRPVSTARSWLMITCSRDAGESRYEESFVVTTISCAPSATNCRNSPGKVFSKQIGVPTSVPFTSNTCTRLAEENVPRPCRYRCVHPSAERHGMYSPNGTRWIFAYESTMEPCAS